MNSIAISDMLERGVLHTVDAASVDHFLAGPGLRVLFFAGPGNQHGDSHDVAVALRELLKEYAGEVGAALVEAGDVATLGKVPELRAAVGKEGAKAPAASVALLRSYYDRRIDKSDQSVLAKIKTTTNDIDAIKNRGSMTLIMKENATPATAKLLIRGEYTQPSETVPAGTPREAVMRLNADTVKALRDPQIEKTLAAGRFFVIGNTPEEFGAYYATGALMLILGLSGWMRKCMNLLPMPIVMAMVAGVFLRFGTGLVHAVRDAVAEKLGPLLPALEAFARERGL